MARIEILTGEYLLGYAPLTRAKKKELLKWIDIHKSDRMKAWNDFRQKRIPLRIPMLN
jgi:hypothetical protein